MDAGQQRAKFAVRGRPAANHDLMSRTAFCFDPIVRASRFVGRIQFFRDDAFKRHAACRFENRVAAGLEMLDVAQQFGLALPGSRKQRLEARLAFCQREGAKIVMA